MKSLIRIVSCLFVGIFFISSVQLNAQTSDVMTKADLDGMTPDDVLEQLKEGNKRFVEGDMVEYNYLDQAETTAKDGQFPKAVVLSCIDSRVPVETIFNQGIGDLFVGRVAGNVETVEQMGSYEFATAIAGSKLIVVLGHSSCGAVKGTIDAEAVSKMGHSNLNGLVSQINPAVLSVIEDDEKRASSNSDLVERVIHENVKHTIADLRTQSNTLAELEEEGKIKIVGAVYDLPTGKVHWME